MRRGYSLLQLFVIAVCKPLMVLLTRREWRGQGHVPRQGGMIVAANHLSWTDPLALSHFLHECGRWPVFLAKSELFTIPVLGRLIDRIGHVPVDRQSGHAGQALRGAERALSEGKCVLFYPEGTCTRDPALWPMAGKTGVARLALTLDVPVIPMAHWGPHRLLPYGKKMPRLFPRKTMRVAAGPPVDLSAYRDSADRAGPDAPDDALSPSPSAENLRGATDEITAAITRLLADLRGERPPAAPYPRTERESA